MLPYNQGTTMKVLRIKRTPLYDVFVGEGWKEWSRYLHIAGKTTYVSGKRLPKHLLNKLEQEIKKNG